MNKSEVCKYEVDFENKGSNSMKKFLTIIIISLMVFVFGCIFNGDEDKEEVIESSTQVDTYYFASGIGSIKEVWVYTFQGKVEFSTIRELTTYNIPSDSANGDGDLSKAEEYFPLKVGAIWTYRETQNDGTSYTSVTSEVTGTEILDGKTYFAIKKDLDTAHMRTQGNIVYIHALEEELRSWGIEEGPLYDFNKSQGETWNVVSVTKNWDGNTVSINIIGKYIGLQDVTVPAGTFKNCAVFELYTEQENKY